MASASDHINLANRNHATLCYLLKEKDAHSEWVATVAFYKAVQIVEAVFDAVDSKHSHGHDDRIDRLKRPKYFDLFKCYRPLYVASLVARYLEDSASKKVYEHETKVTPYKSFGTYMSADDVVKRLLSKRLKPLEEHAVGILGDPLKSALQRIEVVV